MRKVIVMSFEKSLKELEEVLKKLETTDTSLEDGIKLFERGVVLTKECFDYLESYKGKLTVLKNELKR